MEKTDKKDSVPMRGMRDLLPAEVSLRQSVISTIRKVYESYGFLEIETPIVERSELLQTGEGGDNEKQVFGVMRRGLSSEDINSASSPSDLIDGGLRYDLTVPLARYYAQNQAKLPSPFKVLQIGSVFRAERPQKGRYRQFTQCDIDMIGDESTLAERELILATAEALTKIGFAGFTVRVNDRRILKGIVESCGYAETDFESVLVIVDKLDKIGLDGVAEELNNKNLGGEPASKLIDFLRQVADDPFASLPPNIDQTVIADIKEIISSVQGKLGNDAQIVFDPTLVRGMGYYTGPIFEIVDKDFPSSIAGGGRYDKMIGKYTGQDVPACGFSIGFERIMSILEERNTPLNTKQDKKVLIFDPENVSVDFVLNQAKEIRNQDTIVLVQKRKKNTKKQLDDLTELGYSSFCLLTSESDQLEFKSIE